MKRWMQRGAAFGLALLMTAGAAGASASDALGWEIHTGRVPLSQGTELGKNIFWSDTYSDLRTEHYITYAPNENVTPTVAYGSKVLTRATLTSMAQGLESQGRRVVSGINGDFYVLATGAPVGLLVTDGVLRSTQPYNVSWAIGFRADGTAFIGTPNVSVAAVLGGQAYSVSGGVNKVRKPSASDGSGGLTLLTSDFASTTQNTEAGVDVILSPAADPVTGQVPQLKIGSQLTCTVEQVLESTGATAIPEGKLVLTLNGKDKAELLAALRALQAGDTVTLSATSPDSRWDSVTQAVGGMYKLVTGGVVESGLNAEQTARSAVGIRADGSLVFYTVDGKQSGYSVGATLTQCAKRLVELGCVEAVCLDGGGSTTLGVTYPDQSGMQVITSPSDGTQRANSNAIFLTTELAPTGELASYYVTPADSMVLSGATLNLTATGVDSHFYAMTGASVGWSVTSGGGAVDDSGVFTAGSESGFVQVTASDGRASGSAYITTVATPDAISLTREDTGDKVEALNLDPGEQVDLKASAVYKKMALVSQDANYTWTADPAVGSVDANGVFTAGQVTASGDLTVSAGGRTVTVPVSVAGHVNTLEDCEGDLYAFAATETASFASESDLNYVRYGRKSLRLDYDAAGGAASLTGVLSIPAGERYLGVWVYGDGSGNTLMATTADANLQSRQLLLTALDFTGWKHVSAALPEGAVAVSALDVIYGGGEGKQTGTLWLDQFTVSNEEMHDTTPPALTLTVSGTAVSARVTDDVDRSIPQKNLSLTYDGERLGFTWNESTGTLSATLPAADAGYHRVSVSAADASGNLSRASADVLPAGERTQVFTDMGGHWADAYAAFLYDAGVTNGVSAADGSLLYQPDKNITRAEFFALTARWLGLDLSQYAGVELPFADSAELPEWALNEVKAMYALGIVNGALENGVLKVNALSTISRAEAMTILGRTQAKGYAQAELTFDDAALVPSWAADYVKSLAGQGVVSGYNNRIRPNDPLTRGEVAKLLYSMR